MSDVQTIPKWFKESGSVYQKKTVVTLGLVNDLPHFSEIYQLVLKFDQLYLIVKELNTITYDENKCSYEVVKTSSVTCVSKESIIIINVVTFLVTVSDGKLYVPVKFFLKCNV